MNDSDQLSSRVAALEGRVRELRAVLDGSRAADRALCDEYRSALRLHEDAAEGPVPSDPDLRERLSAMAREGLLYLGGEADVWSWSLKDYDHERYGPYLGVSDEGSATDTIRRAAFDSPKARALDPVSPLTVGVAHDAERLGAIGEVPVGPYEYADIRLACTGRILTSTNVGTRLNVRFYKRHPTVEVAKGPASGSLAKARKDLRRAFRPFLQTPDGRPRPLTVFVEFHRDSRRSFADRLKILRELAGYVKQGGVADPTCHALGLQMRIRQNAPGRRGALLAVNLASAAGLSELALAGIPRRAADAVMSLPGLLNYLSPEHLQPVLDRAAAKGVRVRPVNRVDPDTVARNVWTSLLAARRMGLALGKYGTFPLTLEETDQVVGQVQGWFGDWSAAPVFFVDQGIVSAGRVYVGDSVVEGLRAWLQVVAGHGVRVVLVDTVDKSKGWRILEDPSRPGKGLLSVAQVQDIDAFAGELGVKVLWAGGITLPQTYEFGRMGVFGVYVTSAAASALPISAAYEADPLLSSMKEPTYEGVYRAKLLLEAGFLSESLEGSRLGREIRELGRSLATSPGLHREPESISDMERRLAERALEGWRQHLL